MNSVIIVINWTLSPDYILYAWIPKDLHISQPYTKIKECYTGRTTGEIIDNRLEVLYEYKVYVTNLSKIIDNDYDNNDVYWQGYHNNYLVAFDFCTRNKNKKYSIQTIEEIDGIVRASLKSMQIPPPTPISSSSTSITEPTIITTTHTTTTHTTTTHYTNNNCCNLYNPSEDSFTLPPNGNKNNKRRYHKFKISEGIVVCKRCGSTPSNLIETFGYDVDGRLPSCIG